MPYIGAVMGSLHQGSGLFPSAGTQCTAIALFAIATMFATNLLSTNFTTFDVDRIVFDGNNLYESIIENRGFDLNTYLAHDELPQTVFVNGQEINTAIYHDIFYGVVGQETQPVDSGATLLRESLRNAFQLSEYILGTFGSVTISLIYENGQYYVFDSHACNYFGHTDPYGNSVVLQYSDFESLIDYLSFRYRSNIFNISPVIMTTGTAMDVEEQTGSFGINYLNDGGNIQGNERAEHITIDCEMSNPFIENNAVSYTSDRFMESNHTNTATKFDTDMSNMFHINNGNRFVERYFGNENIWNTFMTNVDSSAHIDVEEVLASKKKVSNHSYCLQSNMKKKGKYTTRHPNLNDFENLNHCERSILENEISIDCNFDIDDILGPVVTERTVEVQSSSISDVLETDNFSANSVNAVFLAEIRKRPSFVCCSCDRFLYENQVHRLKTESFISQDISLQPPNVLCSLCFNSIKSKKVPILNSKANHVDPGFVPNCLKSLSLMERRLICKIQVFMTIIILPGGQFAEKGLAIDFPINFNEQINVLPHPFETSNVITVSYEYNKEVKPTHVVRKNKILKALAWLKDNNILYQNISVEADFLRDVELSDVLIDQVEDLYDEYGIISVNYTVPDVNLAEFIRSDTPHVSLKKCDSQPVNAFEIEGGEESAFPHLFPYGINGYKHNRNISITNSKYFQHRVYYKDGRFRKDISYLLHAVNFYERCRLLNSVNIHMRMRKGRDSLTAGDVVDFSQNPDLLQNSYMFMKNVKGTAAYWKNNLLNLLATFKSIGPPSLFVTLSANDMHWPDLIMALSGCDFEAACKVTNALSLVKKDPVLTAIHFQRRFKSLLKNVICGSPQPFGKIIDHFGRIEFQNRGSPHIHLFFWVENFGEIFNDQKLLIDYIDKVISTDCSKSKLATRYQRHYHSEYCLRKSGRCRFGFPFDECKSTRLLSNVDLGSQNLKTRFYETKRGLRDNYINAYNPVILENWQANMDIQVIGDSKSAAYYVCAYLCKSEPEGLRFALSRLLQTMDRNTGQRSRMLKIGSCILKTRKLSAQEAAYRLLPDLNLISSSRTVISLNTKPPAKRFRVLKSKKDREELDENSTDVFYINVVDYYKARPSFLATVCLYDFVASYTKCTDKGTSRVCYSNRLERIKLNDPFADVVMRKRRKTVVVRLPKFSISSDDYYYNLLMSFLPFTNENELLRKSNGSTYEMAKDAFVDKKTELVADHLQSYTVVNEIENAMRFIQCSRLELASSLNPSTFENDDLQAQDEIANISVPFDETTTDLDPECSHNSFQCNLLDSVETTENDVQQLHELQTSYLSKDELEMKLKKLTSCQSKVMKAVMDHYKNKAKDVEQLLIFITGGAGVGKSYVTKLIIDWLNIVTAKEMGKSPVLVCAPTGTAARNILGITLHSALHLPVQHGRQPNFLELSGKTLNKFRSMYAHVHTIIIDEISMVSSATLDYIHKRLSSIKNNENLFGGLNVILVGDFLQLRPVKGHYAFENRYLWSFFKTFFLDTNVRQKNDCFYAQLLNRARVGLLNKDDISALQSRLIHPIPHNITKILHLFPTLKQVNHHNNKMQTLITADIVTIPAAHYFSQEDLQNKISKEVDEDLIPTDDRQAGGLPRYLNISTGTRIMLMRNIHAEQGLVNGALGYVERIKTDEMKQIVTTVFVKFDDDTIGGILRTQEEHNAIAIEVLCQEFYYKGRVIIREQFPLIPAWAATIHKVQGLSLDKAAISIGKDVFENGMAYVALSRVKMLSGLFLLAFNHDKICPPVKAIEEYNRLRSNNSK